MSQAIEMAIGMFLLFLAAGLGMATAAGIAYFGMRICERLFD